MSLALYRKYRPGRFADVRGQEHVTGPLQQALRGERVHHAYLFSGPRGCGKTSCARILARSLNCAGGPTPEPCGECEPCQALAPTGSGSIDVIEIDAASHGGVDDARDLRERAFFAPAAARYKVYVIDEAHMVTREGFNALLRLVEEPPPHLKFVFATTEPDKVIGTIRSRTHHYPFRLLPPSQLRELLADVCAREGIEVEPAAFPLVVRAGAGSVRDALSILDQILAGAQDGKVTYAQTIGLLGYTDASLLDEVVEAFVAGDGAAVFEAVGRVVESGHDPRRFAADLLERFRDLLVLRSVPDAGSKGLLDQPPDQLERMSTQAGRMGAAELSRAADLFHQGLTEMRGATSPRLLLELICARVLLPGAGSGEAALLARVERVERRMAISGPSAPGTATADAPEPAPAPGTAGPDPPSRRTGDSEQGGSLADGGARAGAGRSSGLDVTAVRRAWPDVLENVKKRRRVAWMILVGDVEVTAVDERSLTLAFAKDGDRRGFSASECDRVLQQALYDVLGAQWEIRTVSRGEGEGEPHSHPDAQPGQEPDGPSALEDSPSGSGAAGEPRPRGEPGLAAGAGGAEPDPGTSDPAAGGGPSPGRGPDSGEQPPTNESPAGPERGERTAARSPRSRDGGGEPGGGQPAPEVTGMALIQRELGGEIIEEVDDS